LDFMTQKNPCGVL